MSRDRRFTVNRRRRGAVRARPPLRLFRRGRTTDPPARDRELVSTIQGVSGQLQAEPDSELTRRGHALRQSLAGAADELTEDTVCQVFALVNEALARTVGFRYYPVQLLAGLSLLRGEIAEMQTGEGKTVTAALPAVLHGLCGHGVHVATVNAYLAERDCEQLSGVFRLLGISTGLLSDDDSPAVRRAAYACDVTYGTGYAFGFDYLRDQLALRERLQHAGRRRFRDVLRGEGEAAAETVQRGLHAAIIDEADSVLIDDAATPLILSAAAEEVAADAPAHELAGNLTGALLEDRDFLVDRLGGHVEVTEEGRDRVHAADVAIPVNCLLRPWHDYVQLALRARHLLRRDVHYVVDEGEVRIVDQTTGRIHAERQWSGGLHQAVQAREGVTVRSESEVTARITRQRFYQLYSHISGMTGTAAGGERELWEMYGLPVVRIPTHRPCVRVDETARGFASGEARWDAVVAEVVEVHSTGRPVLVGTRTIAASELLAEMLTERGIDFALLNGKQDANEAGIIAAAGQSGRVTIATNMAGRGTDISLCERAREAGGLHVVGTEHHESTRIDRQLSGRAARQGDPGSVRFYFAASDQLIQKYEPSLGLAMNRSATLTGELTVDHRSSIARLQRRVERHCFLQRRAMYEQDRVQNEILNLDNSNAAARSRAASGSAVG